MDPSIGAQSPRPSPTANTTPRYAPHITSEPWAKFTTSRMENVMASPMAMSAYRLPSVSALIACWRSTAPMVPNLSRPAQPDRASTVARQAPAVRPCVVPEPRVCYARRP